MSRHLIQEISSGGVIVKRVRTRYEVCLVLRDRYGHRDWCLPKGHGKRGENWREAALREVREETGLHGQVIEPLGTIRYQFIRPTDASKVSKRVRFFLMRVVRAGKRQDTNEVIMARWMPLDKAIETASYESEQRILKRAKQLVSRTEVAA